MPPNSRLIDNLASVRQRIATAAQRSGRSAEAVQLVAVTKYVATDVIRELIDAGCHDLGESRPQMLWDKAAALADPSVRWHLIGHLQRNKVERTVPLVALIHSADSQRLLQSIDAASLTRGQKTAVLLEVNISGDAAKHGFTPAELERQLPALAEFSQLEICGLMGMASLAGDLDQARREFANLRQLRDRLQRIAPPTVQLVELSMGMSGDFEIAIEEGATIVRVGSALFQ